MPIKTSSKIHAWIDSGNKIVQIIALFIAGVWTSAIFVRTSAPGLESKLYLRSEVSWQDTADKDVCTGAFRVWVKNESQRDFDIDTVRVTARLVDMKAIPEPSAPENPIAISPQFLREGRVLNMGDAQPLPLDLIDHYAPGTQNESEATYRFRRLPNQLIFLRTDVSGKESKVLFPPVAQREISNYTWTSDQLCGH
jgi:hypothetical protein